MNVNEMEKMRGGMEAPSDNEKTQGWFERENGNWPRMGVGWCGWGEREAINNSLVYSGWAATLCNTGHPGGDERGGKKEKKCAVTLFVRAF